MRKRSPASIGWRTASRVLVDVLKFLSLGFRSRAQLAAENLFLRKQLALYAERRIRACRADDATRITLVLLARLIDLASRADHRETGHPDQVASQRISPILAVEVEGARPAAAPSRRSTPDCRNGSRERHMG